MISLLHKARYNDVTVIMNKYWWFRRVRYLVAKLIWRFQIGQKNCPNILRAKYWIRKLPFDKHFKRKPSSSFLRTNLMKTFFFHFQIAGLNATINSEHYVLPWLQCTILLVYSCCNSDNYPKIVVMKPMSPVGIFWDAKQNP